MFCIKCGAEASPGQKFCLSCGASLLPSRDDAGSSSAAPAPAGRDGRRRVARLWVAGGVAVVLIAGAAVGAYFGLRDDGEEAGTAAIETTAPAGDTTSAAGQGGTGTSTSGASESGTLSQTTTTARPTTTLGLSTTSVPPATSTTLPPGQEVRVTLFGGTITLPAGWEVTKPLMTDSNDVSWFEATGPRGSFLRCISQTDWTDWKPDPESYHEGDKANLIKNHPDVVDVSLTEEVFSIVTALRWEFTYTDGGVAMAGIAWYFPRDAGGWRTPSELAVRFPDDPETRAQVEQMLDSFTLASGE